MLDRIRRAYRELNRKALADRYPETLYREHLTAGAVADATTAAIENYVGYATLFKSYVWVHKAVSIIANNFAPLPVGVVDGRGQAMPTHVVSILLNKGNPHMDPARMWAVACVHKLLGGEWFLEEVPDQRGRPAELWPRRPDTVMIYPDEREPFYPTVLEYEVVGMKDRIPADSMIHDPFVNPLSEWRGLSPTGAALAGIKLDIYNQAASSAFARNGSRPDYAITTTEAQTPDERKRLEIQVAERYGSPEGRARPMILESGQGIQVLSFPPKDTEGLAQREMSRDEVAAVFGVPDILMGFGNDSYDTEEKRRGAEAALWTLTLSPLVFRRDTVLTWFYRRRGLLKPDERIATDLSGVSALQEDILPKLDAAAKLFSMGVPYNVIEGRLRLGTGPIPSGSVGYLPTSIMPADMVALPQLPTQTRAQAAPDATSATLRRDVTRSGMVTRANAQQTAQALRRIKLEAARRMEPEIAAALADLADTVVSRARKGISADTFKANGATTLTATVVKDLPSLNDLIGLRDLDPVRLIIERYAIDVCRASWETWNAGLFVDVLFDRADPAVVAAIAQGGDRIVDILDTTRDAIRRTLEWATENSLSLSQFVNGDEDHPGLAQIVEQTYQNRARTIARTELAFAQNDATLTRFEGVGVTHVEVFDNGVEDSDPRCTELNGTIQSLAWARANPLQHPNCLRTFAPVID